MFGTLKKTIEKRKALMTDEVSKMKNGIISLLEGTQYSLISFDYSFKYFGNMIVELKKRDSDYCLRFITDRGDIYIEHLVGEKWKKKDFYPPSRDGTTTYALLQKAIADFTK